MNIHDFFDDPDDAFIDIITEKYPVLDTDEKERLYAMSKNKYNSDIKNDKNNGTEVSGVERYHKPLWHKVLSAVAAAIVVIGGVGGGVLLLGKGGGVDPMTDIEATEPAEEEVTEAAEVEETEPEIEQADHDYTAIATQLTDKFLDFENIICCGDVSYDKNQSIEFYLYDSNTSESSDNMSKISFNKVTGERFNCRQDVYDELRKIFSDSYYPDDNMKNAMWVDGGYLISYLGDDFSMYENGGKIDIAENFDNDDEVIFVYGTFCEYNGELYVRFDDERPDISEIISRYTTDIVITDIGDNHFTAKRCVSRYGWDNAYGTELIFDFILENGEWVIENYREGMDVERSAAMVLEQYLRDSYSYDNVILNADDMRIQDVFYDSEFCSIHVILIDYNGVEALDIEASISLAENKVLSANITKLN